MEDGDQIDGFGSSACVILGECRQLAFLGFEYAASSFFSFSTPPIASKGPWKSPRPKHFPSLVAPSIYLASGWQRDSPESWTHLFPPTASILGFYEQAMAPGLITTFRFSLELSMHILDQWQYLLTCNTGRKFQGIIRKGMGALCSLPHPRLASPLPWGLELTRVLFRTQRTERIAPQGPCAT